MSNEISWETINAYVDGELSVDDSAEVAKAVAADSGLAKQVAVLSALRASVARSVEGGCPEINLYDDPQGKVWWPWVASLAWLVVGGVALMTLSLRTDWTLPLPGLRAAQQAHQTWLHSSSAKSADGKAGALKTNLRLLELDAYVPDLSKVNLSFNGIRKVPARGGDGLHIGYKGPSGCMVSLVVFKRHLNVSESLTSIQQQDKTVYLWRVNKTSFYLMAFHMDRPRLTKIARVIYRMTRDRVPLDSNSALVLDNAKRTAKPCLT